MDSDIFVMAMSVTLVLMIVWAFVMDYKKIRAENENLRQINEDVREDVLALLGLANIIFLSRDVKIKKQSTLARVFFNYKDLEEYKWDNKNEDCDSFWDEETLDKFELNDDTEDQYFAAEERIEFLKKNFYRKIQDLNQKYDSWNNQDSFDEISSDDQLKLFQKIFDKITS